MSKTRKGSLRNLILVSHAYRHIAESYLYTDVTFLGLILNGVDAKSDWTGPGAVRSGRREYSQREDHPSLELAGEGL